MKYSSVLAVLAASAIATPFVDIAFGEDAVSTSSRRHHRHRDNRGWFSSLLGNCRWNPYSHRHGKHQHHHNGHRHHHNDHRRHHALSRGDGDEDGNPMDGEHYECVLTAKHDRDERENTRHCCNEQGGELYESRGHCIFRDSMGSPHEEWQACGMMARGTDFAACYQREQREIDDELAGRGWHNEEKRHNHHGRHGRHGRNHHGGRMEVLDDGNDGDGDHHGRKHGKHGHRHGKQEVYDCRIDLDDENRRHELLEQCCEDQVRGDLNPDSQTCGNVRRRDTMLFENCAMAQGAQKAECYKHDDNDGGDDGGHDGDGDGDGNDGRFGLVDL